MSVGRAVIPLLGPHRPRLITYSGVTSIAGWTMKMYGIAAQATPRTELMSAAVEATGWALPQPPPGDGHYGIGFVIAHDAADYCFVLVDWWSGETEVHQRIFSAPLNRPDALRPHAGDAIGCVWELAVTDFERRAWLRHVLANPDGPDLDAYLAAHFEGVV